MPRVAQLPLTDQQVRSARPKANPVDLRDGFSRGLVLKVLPSGQKVWTVRYRYRGTQRRLQLGEYPQLSLAKAREKAEDMRTAIRKGQDPAGELRLAKEKPSDTIGALVADYIAKHVRVKQRGRVEEERILNVEILPRWKARSVREITRRDVRALVEPIAERGSPIMANRTLAVVRRVLNFGIRNDWLDGNPAALIDKPGQEQSRDRVLNDDEIRRLWWLLKRQPTTDERPAPGRKRALGTADDPICPVSPALAAVVAMRLLTAQRGGEVLRMRWQDLDLDSGWWTIPAEWTKNGHIHRVPLVNEALAILHARKEELEPPKKGIEKRAASSESDFVFVGTGASVRDRAKKAPSRIARALGIDFRGHDLRRTAATKMAESGVPRHHISAVLNHVEHGPRATRVYDRYNYDNEKRAALEVWARRLHVIANQQSGTQILSFGT